MRLRKFDRLSRSKSSNVPIRSAALWSCPNAVSSSAPLRGSIAAAAWLKTGSASTERPWHSYASHQFASCSENFAIRPEVSGQTLRLMPRTRHLNKSAPPTGQHAQKDAIMPATLDLVAHRKRDELKNNSGESTSM